MTSATRPIRSDDHTLQPGGRWERVLTAISGQSLTVGALLRATDPGKHHRRNERHRILRALVNMANVGLVTRVEGWGWTATEAGRDALAGLWVAPAAPRASDSAHTCAQAARDRVPSVSASICAQAASLREASDSAQTYRPA